MRPEKDSAEDAHRIDDLVRRAANGDTGAVSELTGFIEPAIRRAARRGLGHGGRNRVDTDDVVQEALLTLMPQLATFEYRGAQSFDAWVSRIAERAGRLARRFHHAQRRDLRVQRSIGRGYEPVHDGTTPTRAARRTERVRSVREALASSSERHRQVIHLRSVAGEDFHEIARAMGLGTASSARSLFARALRELERHLTPRAGNA